MFKLRRKYMINKIMFMSFVEQTYYISWNRCVVNIELASLGRSILCMDDIN